MPEEKAPHAGAGAAAVLIGIILLIFIFYLLLLPPEERELILKPEITRTVFQTSPGTLEPLVKKEISHKIPDFTLKETLKATVIKEFGSFTLTSGLFYKKFATFEFDIKEPENLENVFLSFQAPRRSGELVIKLNSIEIFSDRLGVDVPPPIPLSKALLNKKNKIEFQVFGGLLEGKNYKLTDVRIIGDLLEISQQLAKNTFVLSAADLALFNSASLRYLADCDQNSIGRLSILLNGKEIFNGIPLCGAINTIGLAKDELLVGRNVLIFKLESGELSLENINVKILTSEASPWSSTFALSPNEFRALQEKQAKLLLEITFSEAITNKVADILINGRTFSLSQKGNFYSLDISAAAKEGENLIAIVPETKLDIIDLVVKIE